MSDDPSVLGDVGDEVAGARGGVCSGATLYGLCLYLRCYYGCFLGMQIIRSMYNTEYVLSSCEHNLLQRTQE